VEGHAGEFSVETNPYSDIGRKRIDFWDEDNLSLSLFRYKPGKSGTDEVTQFILGFKALDSACLQAAAMQIYDAVGKFSEDWKREQDCRHIVPVPSHIAHKVSPSSKLVCHFIAKKFPWLQYPEELLFRRESVIPAHQAYPGQRPTSMEHFESLGCSKVDLGRAGVILFDDVRTTGDTSQACKRRLQLDAKCGEVVRLFLGRTEA
jgi:predicted amidophosphoribosyltransferase